MHIKNINSDKGISVIEVIIATTIITVSIISITMVYANLVTLSLQNTNKVQSVFLLEEGAEAVKTIRNNSWSSINNLSTTTDYYLTWQNNKWQSTTTSSYIDNLFLRKFRVRNVYRDPVTLNIVSSGGVLSNDTKIIDVEVAWKYKGATTTKQNSFYIFNLYE